MSALHLGFVYFNLLTIYSILNNKTKEEAASEFSNMGWGQFKPLLADSLVSKLEPIQKNYKDLMNDPSELNRVLIKGKDNANKVAQKTLTKVRDALGFVNREN